MAFVLSLVILRLLHNRWATKTLNQISLGLFLYAAIILSIGAFEITRRIIDGSFP